MSSNTVRQTNHNKTHWLKLELIDRVHSRLLKNLFETHLAESRCSPGSRAWGAGRWWKAARLRQRTAASARRGCWTWGSPPRPPWPSAAAGPAAWAPARTPSTPRTAPPWPRPWPAPPRLPPRLNEPLVPPTCWSSVQGSAPAVVFIRSDNLIGCACAGSERRGRTVPLHSRAPAKPYALFVVFLCNIYVGF